MKIPITDQFLLDVLNLTGGAADFLTANRYRRINMLTGMENPVLKKYRKDKNKRQFDRFIY